MNNLSRVGVDLAKNIFQLHGIDRTETTIWCRRLKRDNWIKVLLNKVEPALAKPVNVQVHKARESNWESTRE